MVLAMNNSYVDWSHGWRDHEEERNCVKERGHKGDKALEPKPVIHGDVLSDGSYNQQSMKYSHPTKLAHRNGGCLGAREIMSMDTVG